MLHRLYFLKPLGIFALLALILLAFSQPAFAASISQVKGNKVLIDLTDSEMVVNEGARYLVIIDGKRRGIVQISKVKGKKALGEITKGRAEVGATITSPSGAGKRKKARSSDSDDNIVPATGRNSQSIFIGALAGYAMNSQKGKFPDGGTLDAQGSAFNLRAYGDFPLSESVGAIGRLGIQNFSVSQSSNNVNGQATVMYLAGDFLLRYSFGSGGFVPYAAVGLGTYFPLSKSATILEESSIVPTSVFYLGGGANFYLSESFVVTGSLEWGMFPPGTITTTMIDFRAGVGWRY